MCAAVFGAAERQAPTLREALVGRADLADFNEELLETRVPEPPPGRRFTLVQQHLTPSAARTAVFSSDYTFIRVLNGWELARLPNESIVYQQNMVHFAPTQSLAISAFDPQSSIDRQIYPPDTIDPVRTLFIARVSKAYQSRGESWFRINNHHMDATRFDTRLVGQVMVDRATATVQFEVRFGDPSNGRDPLPFTQGVRVTCAPLDPVSRIECRERGFP